MKFTTSIDIRWPIDKTFDAMKSPAMMQQVAWPLVKFKAKKPEVFPERWQDGQTYKMSMYLLGFLPMGWQELKIFSEQDLAKNIYTLKDVGPGWAVKWWDHKVVLSKVTEQVTHYDEELNLKTALLAPVIWLGMGVLFKWRKYRWLQLAK